MYFMTPNRDHLIAGCRITTSQIGTLLRGQAKLAVAAARRCLVTYGWERGSVRARTVFPAACALGRVSRRCNQVRNGNETAIVRDRTRRELHHACKALQNHIHVYSWTHYSQWLVARLSSARI
jgi:hypothetical protein